MEYIFICPKCKTTFGYDPSQEDRTCPDCKVATIFSGHTDESWAKLSPKEKMEIKRNPVENRPAPPIPEKKPAEERIKRFSGSSLGLKDVIYHIAGARGRVIDIYPHKCVITTGVTIGSIVTWNATDGEKTIYYQDCIGLQVKYPALTIGYIQFETAASTMNNVGSNFFNENSFTFEETQISSDEMKIVVDYIKAQLEEIKNAQRNMWLKAMQ